MPENKHPTPQDPVGGDAPHPEQRLDKNEVRQGVTGHKVRYVLMISTALAVVGVVLAYIWLPV